MIVGICLVGVGLLLLVISLLIGAMGRKRRQLYSGSVPGTVTGHRWVTDSDGMSYPYAEVSYWVDGLPYICRQHYSVISYNSIKHAERDWMVDENFGLHMYDTRKCEIHVDPEELFPVGSTLEVHYVPDNPGKAYAGMLGNMKIAVAILVGVGAMLAAVGAVLMVVM